MKGANTHPPLWRELNVIWNRGPLQEGAKSGGFGKKKINKTDGNKGGTKAESIQGEAAGEVGGGG